VVAEGHEVVHLAGDRPEAANLEHQPLKHGHARHRVARPEQPALLAQVDQDRARLEYADRPARRALGVDDRRDLVVRADLQEGRVELLALADVDDVHFVGQAHLFERDADLAAIGGVEGVQLDAHAGSFGEVTELAEAGDGFGGPA